MIAAFVALLAALLPGCFPVLMAGAVVSAPWMQQTPNSSCYVVDKDMAQARPCRVEETR